MADAPFSPTIHTRPADTRATTWRRFPPWSTVSDAIRSLDALLSAWSASAATGITGPELPAFTQALAELSGPDVFRTP